MRRDQREITRYSVITERRMQIRQHLDSCGYVAELRLHLDMFGGTHKTPWSSKREASWIEEDVLFEMQMRRR